MRTKLNKIFTTVLILSVAACNSPLKVAEAPKPGFSNITDIPLPESAKIDLTRSMVMGGGDNWTGRLVYESNKRQEQVIDFLNERMQSTGWTKISELRGKDTVITMMKDSRVATLNVTDDNGLLSKSTIVSVDMTHSNLKNALVHVQPK